jgi:hypothetical protein
VAVAEAGADPKTRHRGRLKGAVQYRDDAALVPMLDVAIRVGVRQGMAPFSVIRWFLTARDARHVCGWGASDDATVHRLYQKWRAGAFRKYQPPPGIDPDKFHF